MVTLVPLAVPLPPDLAITYRSRQFYDGTYKWDSEGFTDDQGVYRVFDCLDPVARAPTPMPPIFSDDEDGYHMGAITNESTQPIDRGTITAASVAAVEPDKTCPKPNGSTTILVSPRTPGSIRRFAIDFLANFTQSKITQQEELDRCYKNENNASTHDGIMPLNEQEGTAASRHRQQKQCEGLAQANNESTDVKMPETSSESPITAALVVQSISSASTISALPPVPSNLSEQDKDLAIKIKGTSTTVQSTPELPNTPSKIWPQSKTTAATTRGTAQKVRKGFKRAVTSRTSPSKRKENSVENFTLL